ncbi:MAG: dihydrolipoyl dehydrogenase [Desulfuromonadales bacterium]|nr:dihydrolipoyl dehydrogenase [Desulfuromonadales bacterium]MDT8423253.1 dihydrolipoyl dehydrogenase [Desulfuromonadales bacterium]
MGSGVKSKKYDYNIAVIGGGSAGLMAAYIAAAVKAKVVLIEKRALGGDCLNRGCVPSKALLRCAKMAAYANRAQEFGFKKTALEFDFCDVLKRVKEVVDEIAPHDSVARYVELGVDCVRGNARLVGPHTIAVDGRTITARNIVIATGARPFVPPFSGLEQVDYLTSETIWSLREQPKRLAVVGGGAIGCELTQAFARLGSEVTQVEMGARILGRDDPEVSELIQRKFENEGVRILTHHGIKEIRRDGQRKILVCVCKDELVEIEFDALLIAVGRKANVSGFGLEELGVKLAPQGTIAVDDFLRTNFPHIYCAGDVAGPFQFSHTAAHQAWYAAVNALFGGFKSFRVDYSVVPWATYTDPEVAQVGLNESAAKRQKIPCEAVRYDFKDIDRAVIDRESQGFVKVLTKPGTDKILGVTIVGSHASDLIAEYILAMKHGIGLNKILGTMHIYPTLAEVNKATAEEWKRLHAPQKLLRWVARFHDWRRG